MLKFNFSITAFFHLLLATFSGFIVWYTTQMINILSNADDSFTTYISTAQNIPYPVWRMAQLGRLYDMQDYMGKMAFNLADGQGTIGAIQTVSTVRLGFIIAMILLLFLFAWRSIKRA